MFGAIKRLSKKVNGFNQEKAMRDILKDPYLRAEIIDLNQAQMYEQGVDAAGDSLGEYAPITKSYYKPLAASEGRDGRTDHVTLKDTGDFYRSMEIKTISDGIHLIADYEKEDTDLKVIYPHALGLTPESKMVILPGIRSVLLDKIKNQMYSKTAKERAYDSVMSNRADIISKGGRYV
jgi:hypothetical protein